jgi:hypothetical protein
VTAKLLFHQSAKSVYVPIRESIRLYRHPYCARALAKEFTDARTHARSTQAHACSKGQVLTRRSAVRFSKSYCTLLLLPPPRRPSLISQPRFLRFRIWGRRNFADEGYLPSYVLPRNQVYIRENILFVRDNKYANFASSYLFVERNLIHARQPKRERESASFMRV